MPTATVIVKWIPEVEKRIGQMVDDAIREATARYFDTLFATDIDPPAVNTPNPKEYAGEADAVEELAPLWVYECMGQTWYSGEFTVMRGARPAKSLADRIKEIEMKKKRRVTIDPHTTTIGELMHLADCVLPQEILCPITRNGTAGELLEAVEKWLNDPQKPESKQEPTERTPTHFASIAPRYPGEQTPQDIAARKQREDAEIERAWKIAAAYYISPEKEIGDFLREYANRCIKVSCSMQANSNRWSIYFQQNSYPRDIVGAVIGEGHPGITRFSYERTGAELLALLFPEPIMGHKENPSAWMAVEDGLPNDGEVVLVRLFGRVTGDKDKYALGEHRYLAGSWRVQSVIGDAFITREMVTHWRRIE